METAFNKDVKDFFKKKRGYVSNDSMITFYTIKDKRQYDMCVSNHSGFVGNFKDKNLDDIRNRK